MNISLICVGKVKEAFFRDALSEYSKRLSAYCDLKIVEVEDEPDSAGIGSALKKEADRILKNIKPGMYVITLEINGKKLTSEGFSEKLSDLLVSGKSDIAFIIGGSNGLDRSVRDASDLALSFSDMTFPHQLMRVILTEQIYRAFKIMKNEPYHK